jgi:tetratricopeptide (TPR) repeat protein
MAEAAERRTRARLIRKTGLFRFIPVAAALALSAAAHGAATDPQCGGVTGNPELALKACTRLIEFGGLERRDLAKAYFSRSSEWANQGNHERAVMDLDMAIELDATVPAYYLNRALSSSERGDHNRAVSDYAAALKLAPGDVRMYLGRAVEWTVLGDYKQAQADYDEVIRRQPTDMKGYFGRGRVRFYAGDFMQSASDFTRSHQLGGGIYTAIWLFLARKRADIPAEQTLAQDAGTSGGGDWPGPIVALYLGKSAPDAAQKAAASPDPARQRDQRCEANFYIAHWHLLRSEREAAAQLLRDAQSGCPGSFLENEAAVAELRRLAQKQ